MINNSEIGKRIAYLRNNKGLSQKELADSVNISRPSLAQIERGHRNVSVTEMVKFADNLNFSIDEILAESFSYVKKYKIGGMKLAELHEPEVRISIPKFNADKFKNVILYILEKCAGRPNVGETVLYKLLYFSDFNYYEKYEEHLSGAKYRKLENGPVPFGVDDVLHEMESDAKIKSFTADYFGYKQKRYMPMVETDKRMFNGAEIEVMDKVIEQMGGMSAKEISNYSHEDMPWKASKDRQVINYELAFYRVAPFSVRGYDKDREVAGV